MLWGFEAIKLVAKNIPRYIPAALWRSRVPNPQSPVLSPIVLIA